VVFSTKPNETTEKIFNESKNIAQKIGHGFKTVKAVAAAAKLKEPTPIFLLRRSSRTEEKEHAIEL
jgi:hypothetical protein